MTPEQLQTLLDQNAQLLAQNQQLIATLYKGAPAAAMPMFKAKKPKTKKEIAQNTVTAWYHGLKKSLHPNMAAMLQHNIQKRDLWQD